MRVYKCDRCGSYYDVQSQIGPFYGEVKDEHMETAAKINRSTIHAKIPSIIRAARSTYGEVYSMDGKPKIKGKDLCEDCMKDLKRWFVLCEKEEKAEVDSEDIHSIPIAELGLSTRVETVIKQNVFGIVSIGDIVDLDYKQIKRMRGMGHYSINELVNKLREFRIPYVLHMLDNGNGMFVRKYKED